MTPHDKLLADSLAPHPPQALDSATAARLAGLPRAGALRKRLARGGPHALLPLGLQAVRIGRTWRFLVLATPLSGSPLVAEVGATPGLLRSALLALLETSSRALNLSAHEARREAPGVVAMAACMGVVITETEVTAALLHGVQS